MSLKIHFLGCGAASPSLRHMPSCQVVEHNSRLFMVDCGEGAQLSMRRAGLSTARLRHIFISHLHGDHVFGLPGLLASLCLHDFGGEIHVYIHPLGIPLIQEALRVCAHEPDFELVFHPLEPKGAVLYDDDSLTVSSFPLSHGIPAMGFIFREKPKPRTLRADMAEFYNIPLRQRQAIKMGADFVTDDGQVVANKWLTADPPKPASYAYASDTAFSAKVIEAVRGVELLYHEATYADDRADKAKPRGHSTARQAGAVAAQAGVGRLAIGHFSSAYGKCEDTLLAQAQEEFPNTVLAHEGLTLTV